MVEQLTSLMMEGAGGPIAGCKQMRGESHVAILQCVARNCRSRVLLPGNWTFARRFTVGMLSKDTLKRAATLHTLPPATLTVQCFPPSLNGCAPLLPSSLCSREHVIYPTLLSRLFYHLSKRTFQSHHCITSLNF